MCSLRLKGCLKKWQGWCPHTAEGYRAVQISDANVIGTAGQRKTESKTCYSLVFPGDGGKK
jgi:hypothetical protein